METVPELKDFSDKWVTCSVGTSTSWVAQRPPFRARHPQTCGYRWQMKDILARRFRSRFNVDDALEALQTHASDLGSWRIQESEYDDRYVRGSVSGTKIRLIPAGEHYDLEFWFDSDHDRRTDTAERDRIVSLVENVLRKDHSDEVIRRYLAEVARRIEVASSQ
jgi:hypothetical protein